MPKKEQSLLGKVRRGLGIKGKNPKKWPPWILALLLALTWFVLWGLRAMYLAVAARIYYAAQQGASPNAVLEATLFASAIFGFCRWYHRELLKKYTPALKAKLIP